MRTESSNSDCVPFVRTVHRGKILGHPRCWGWYRASSVRVGGVLWRAAASPVPAESGTGGVWTGLMAAELTRPLPRERESAQQQQLTRPSPHPPRQGLRPARRAPPGPTARRAVGGGARERERETVKNARFKGAESGALLPARLAALKWRQQRGGWRADGGWRKAWAASSETAHSSSCAA